MTIDKSKFTADELAQYEKLIAKATVPDEATKPSESDAEKPENSKPSDMSTQKSATDALPDLLAPMRERMEQLEKSLEMKELLQVAERYEIIGEKPKELAKNLYELKKSSETNYNVYLATLDKALALAEKSGLFTEIGKSSRGGERAAARLIKFKLSRPNYKSPTPLYRR